MAQSAANTSQSLPKPIFVTSCERLLVALAAALALQDEVRRSSHTFVGLISSNSITSHRRNLYQGIHLSVKSLTESNLTLKEEVHGALM